MAAEDGMSYCSINAMTKLLLRHIFSHPNQIQAYDISISFGSRKSSINVIHGHSRRYDPTYLLSLCLPLQSYCLFFARSSHVNFAYKSSYFLLISCCQFAGNRISRLTALDAPNQPGNIMLFSPDPPATKMIN